MARAQRNAQQSGPASRRRRSLRTRDFRRRRRHGAASPALPAVPSFRPRIRGISASTGCPLRRTRLRSWPRSAPTSICTPTSAPGSGRDARLASRSQSLPAHRQWPGWRSTTPTRAIAARTRFPRTFASRDGADRHALIVDRDRCRLYELYALERRGGRWHAGSGAIWSLRSNKLRPAGWTSADAPAYRSCPASRATTRWRAAGSTMRCASRSSAHAALMSIRPVTSRATRPTPHCRRWGCAFASRPRTRSAGFPRQARVVLTALKRYGMVVADNGIELVRQRHAGRALVERAAAQARTRPGLRVRGR